MKTSRCKTLFSSAILLALTATSFAQSDHSKIAVHLDPQKTEIHWTLKATLHAVHGTFQLKGGALTLDPATGAAEGQILVDVTTGQSGDSSRDNKMQKEVLESQKYPEAFFHPIKFSGTVESDKAENVTVDGTFNIHGQDHPLTLQLQIERNGQEATATTRFVVPYKEWGMKDPSTFVLKVDKQVEVNVIAHATIEDATGPAAK
jgi:polyisoprenoid-binding protein YceI